MKTARSDSLAAGFNAPPGPERGMHLLLATPNI